MSNSKEEKAKYPKMDRFLVAILLGTGLLLTLGVVSILFSRQSTLDLPENTPGRTSQLFLKALELHDYEQAYNLLSDQMDHKPSLSAFTRYNLDQANYNQGYIRMQLNSENISGDKATVGINFSYFSNSGSPFGVSSEYNSIENFTLAREDGNWRINGLSSRFLPYYITEPGVADPYK